MPIDNRELATALEERAIAGTCPTIVGPRDSLCFDVSNDPKVWCPSCLMYKASQLLLGNAGAYERGYSDSMKDGVAQIDSLTTEIHRLKAAARNR